MLPRVCSVAVLVVLTLTAAAQPPHSGDPFPLTATRYGTARGTDPRLLSNGREPVAFWSDGRHVRTSRFVNGRFTASRVVGEGFFDVVWTGTHFLLVTTAASPEEGLFARTLDASGEPRGQVVRIAAQGTLPRIAHNGRNVLLLFTTFVFPTSDLGLHALVLTLDGRPLEPEPRSLNVNADGRVAVASNGDSFAALVPNAVDPPLLFFGADGQLRSRSVFHDSGAAVAIATDGRRYLGVTACAEYRLCSPVSGRVIEADGTIGAPLELDEPLHFNPTVVWSGTSWMVSYLRDLHLQDEATLQVVQLDPSARVVEQRRQRPAIEASLGVVGNRVLAAWTTGRYRDMIHAGPVSFEAATSVAASFTANEQTLSGIESSSRGTLVVWQERGSARTTLYVGFRALDGRWSEREIASALPRDCFYCYEESINSSLAGNGEEFLLQVFTAAGHSLRRLDAEGNPLGEPFTLPFFPQHILPAGRDYLLIHGDRSVARMTPSGTIAANAQLPAVVGQASAFAASSSGGMITARIERTYVNHYPRVVGLSVVRLDRDLNPIDTTPIRLAADDQSLQTPAVGWDGRQWVVAWIGREGGMAAQIAESGPANPKVVQLGEGRAAQFVIEAVPGAAAILWRQPREVNRVTFLRHDGTATPPLVVSASDADDGLESGDIAPLPNGDLAYVESSLQEGAPFESTKRVMFRVLSGAPLPAKPAAPHLTTELLPSGEALLTWTAPPQPVHGFRVEARIDDGPWTEVAPLLDRDARAYRVTLTPGSRYAFRIRAWNEAGPGAWSSAGKRRRAVRSATRR